MALPQLALTRLHGRQGQHERGGVLRCRVAQPPLNGKGGGAVAEAGLVGQQSVLGAARKAKPILVAEMDGAGRW